VGKGEKGGTCGKATKDTPTERANNGDQEGI